MEISPISAVRLAPVFRSRETDLGLTDVFEVENSARIGDETYSPGGNGAASGFDDDEDKAEALGVPMVVGAAVRQMLSITQQTFGKDADCTDLVRVVEQWADCEIRGPQNQE